MPAAFDANLGTNTNAGGTTVVLTTAAAVAPGGKIFIDVSHFDSVITLDSVAGGGLTWNFDLKASNGSQHYARASADAPSGLAAGTTITATVSSTTLVEISGFSATGVQTGTTYDGTNSSSAGAGATWSSGAITTANAADILVAGGTQDGSGTATATPNAGYTEVNDFTHAANTESYESVYQIVAATGSYTAGGSFSPSGTQSVGLIVAYKATPSGGGGITAVRIANPRVGPMALRYKLQRQVRWYARASTSTGGVVTFDATIAGVGAVTADFFRQRALDASIAGAGSVSADVVRQRAIDAVIAGNAAIAADIVRQRAVAALIGGLAAIAIDVVRVRALDALVSGTATVIVDQLAVTRVFEAVIAGQAQVIVTLDLPTGSASVVRQDRDFFVVVHNYHGA